MCLLKEPLVVTIAGRENQYFIRRKIPLMHMEHLALKKTVLLYNETAKRTKAMNTSQDKNVTSKIHKFHPKPSPNRQWTLALIVTSSSASIRRQQGVLWPDKLSSSPLDWNFIIHSSRREFSAQFPGKLNGKIFFLL